ncbi:hypothetical protein U879_10960 [Defluviimonas sp. 20V17]|uniref:Translocase n=1 Tax=Allgaiera indica TaxID=765699 RepID=A0AAN4UN66_9RHOB|nr:hypothetical protein [Allgaiera indica]KDB03667.1 hypothetical protein U879_10960 [Defluviimonas sp. 20V17]GHD98428.1 hypothetical protein GCM10008024_01900 [Allgaiera indica]SDW47595.1 hypothetical protein SAMN05444006_10424 [Allgaiera indica]
MNLVRKVSVVAATFLIAAATGQFMQSTFHRSQPAAAPAPVTPPLAAPAAKPAQTRPVQVASLEQPGKLPLPLASAPARDGGSIDALRSAIPAMQPLAGALPAALRGPAPPAPGATARAKPETAAKVCLPRASISVDEGAILHFRLDAPCHAAQRVVIRHGGLAFTELTDAKGMLDVKIPAMQEDARVTAMFAGNKTVSATTTVPELSLYDRVAVEWVGKDSFDLHALEFGAAFGSAGDIWAQNPGSATPNTTAVEGFMTVLGNRSVTLPMLAQVYTYPTGLSTEGGKVKLVIDAVITPETCGREMLAETLRTRRDAAPKKTDLSVAMPDCSHPDGYVQLAGLLPDIQVAGE